MTDLFGSWIPDEFLTHLFAVFAWRQDVTFQLLTKRPQRMAEWFREAFQFRRTGGGIGYHGRQERVFEEMQESPYFSIDPCNDAHWTADGSFRWPGWPLPNVWLGTSVEDQRAADERIPHLIATPAAVRYLSCEPLLGPLDIEPDWMVKLDQIIVGGESGPKHRPMDLTWLKGIAAQVRVAGGVALFTKQDSHMYPGRQGRITDDLWLHEFPRAASAAGAPS
jgi:protein gp37